MKEILKKYWPILALGISVYLIILFFKPGIYSIPVHKTPVKNVSLFPVYLYDTNDDFVDTLDCDSVHLSEGLAYKEVEGKRVISVKKDAQTPLQYIQYWMGGIPLYRTVIVVSGSAENGMNAYAKYLQNLTRKAGDTISLPGLVQDNFEENRIFLKLEKPNPIKILALWQNYAIKGETDGKKVKITVPREATLVEKSMVQVWVTDANHVSHVCRIPLKNGIVQTRQPELNKTEETMANLYTEIIQMPAMGELPFAAQSVLASDMKFILSEPERITGLLYGDFRELNVTDSVRVMLFNYFGKKILFACNYSHQLKNIEFPLKGELRNRMRETAFTLKSGRMNIRLMPQTSEWFY